MSRHLGVMLLLVGYVLMGGAGVLGRPQTFQQIFPQTPTSVGSFPPVTTVKVTNKPCNLRALPRIKDERYCDKYYVCSRGFYVGLYCPIGMAFDYSLQECHLRDKVDCTDRPGFAFGKESGAPSNRTPSPDVVTGVSQLETITTPQPLEGSIAGIGVLQQPGMTMIPGSSAVLGMATATTMRPLQIFRTTTPGTTLGRTTTMRTAIRRVTTPISVTTPTTPSSAITPGSQHMFPMMGQTNVMTLQFGARVTVPAGSAVVLPPGTQIQVNDASQLGTGFLPSAFSQSPSTGGQAIQGLVDQTIGQKTGIQTGPTIPTTGQTGHTHGHRHGHHFASEHAAQQTLQLQPSINLSSTANQEHHDGPRKDGIDKPEVREFDGAAGIINRVNDSIVESPISFQASETFETLKFDDELDVTNKTSAV